jgi:putative transposase
MQVFGLPGHIIRNGRAASRLLDAQTPDIEAARRRDAVARWRRACADGLTVDQAAKAVGVARATLYRWEKDARPKSRRPHRVRGKSWSPALARAVEAARADNPMWGKRKIAVLMRREGFLASDSTVGRILAHLVARGAIVPVPVLRRRPEGRRIRFTAKQRYARRLPRGRKAQTPGELVQIDTLPPRGVPRTARRLGGFWRWRRSMTARLGRRRPESAG